MITMAIAERIRFFRNLRGMTMKTLGMMVGFPERSADVRLAQYENGTRTPKPDMTKRLAYALEVAPRALTVPDIDTDQGLMHTFFTLEDLRGIYIDEINGEMCLRFNIYDPKGSATSYICRDWLRESKKYRSGEITKEEYDHWRYTYPLVDMQRLRERMDAKRREAEGNSEE